MSPTPDSSAGGGFTSPHHGGMQQKNNAVPSPVVQKDIIGIVRELQKAHSEVRTGDRIDGSEEGTDALYRVWHHFPSIAQALLEREEKMNESILVLNNVRQQLIPALALCVIPDEIHNDKWKECPHCRLEAIMGTIQEALSRIRSLPV